LFADRACVTSCDSGTGSEISQNMERKTSRSHKRNVTLELKPVLGASQGIELHARLREVPEDSALVIIDAGKVERIETLALQVLLAFCGARVAAGRDVQWIGVSSEFRRATDLLGLSDVLRLPA